MFLYNTVKIKLKFSIEVVNQTLTTEPSIPFRNQRNCENLKFDSSKVCAI